MGKTIACLTFVLCVLLASSPSNANAARITSISLCEQVNDDGTIPNYEIDVADAVADEGDAVVHFALSRPDNGWPIGNYKLDVYMDGKFAVSAPFSVAGQADTVSYSGSSSDQYGNTDMSWGAAGDQQAQGTWTVRGTREQGVLTIFFQNGNQREINYQVHVENGQVYWSEYFFNGELYGKK